MHVFLYSSALCSLLDIDLREIVLRYVRLV